MLFHRRSGDWKLQPTHEMMQKNGSLIGYSRFFAKTKDPQPSFFNPAQCRLTRRAKHWHSGIIEMSSSNPRGIIRRGFFHGVDRHRSKNDILHEDLHKCDLKSAESYPPQERRSDFKKGASNVRKAGPRSLRPQPTALLSH